MSVEEISWTVVVVAGLVGAFCLNKLLLLLALVGHRFLDSLRAALVVSTLILFICPIQSERAGGLWVPALIELIFESSFQVDGRPAASAALLVMAVTAGFSLIFALSWVLYGKRGSSEEGAT